MEQNLAPYDLEYMKLAMLKQEEIFKQQVYELHRLYRIQKLLMRTPQRKFSKNEHPRVPNEKKHMKNLLLELERTSEHCLNREQSRFLYHLGQNDEAIDLTLGLGTCYNSQRNYDDSNKQSAARLLTSDSVMSFSSSSAGSSSHSKKACVRGIIDDEDREQPPWLLQVLSLNMT